MIWLNEGSMEGMAKRYNLRTQPQASTHPTRTLPYNSNLNLAERNSHSKPCMDIYADLN